MDYYFLFLTRAEAEELDGEVEAEVTEECENFGKVTKVVIYQEKQSADPSAETDVKIFVQFGTPHEVQTAISGLVLKIFVDLFMIFRAAVLKAKKLNLSFL